MYTLTPQLIAEITGGKYIGSEEARASLVTGAVRDNRDVKPGNIFVCIPGERTDGHLYANSAYEAGAACCLAEKEIRDAQGAYVLVDSTLEAIKVLATYHRSQFDIPVIGITGSVGKTTAKELVAAALGYEHTVLKTEKNLNNELGVPLTLMSLNNNHSAAVIEMGISDFGEMSRLAKMVKPDMFIITNIGYSHTKELGDLDGVLRAKTEAFAYMNTKGIAILNGDDERLQTYDPGIRKITFGLKDHNDYRAENIVMHGIDSIEMNITSNMCCIPVKIPAYGRHLAFLAPAAVIVAHMLGYHNREIVRGMSLYEHVEGRSNVSAINGITLINDCYNANPSSVKSALYSLSKLPGRHVAILGDMLNLGNHSKQLHYEIGIFAAECGIDVLLCHGEDSRHIIEGFKKICISEMQHYPEIDLLIRDIPEKIKKGDAVLVKASRAMRFEKLLPVISGLR